MRFVSEQPSMGKRSSDEIERWDPPDKDTLEQSSTEKQHKGKTILVVEDDEGVGEMLTLTLELETSYQPLLVSSGQEALRVVQAVRPTLLLLDYQLPDMTGIEVYDRLQAHKEFTMVPAIMISANIPHEELSKRRLIKLEKPFEIDVLVDLVETVAKVA